MSAGFAVATARGSVVRARPTSVTAQAFQSNPATTQLFAPTASRNALASGPSST